MVELRKSKTQGKSFLLCPSRWCHLWKFYLGFLHHVHLMLKLSMLSVIISYLMVYELPSFSYLPHFALLLRCDLCFLQCNLSEKPLNSWKRTKPTAYHVWQWQHLHLSVLTRILACEC